MASWRCDAHLDHYQGVVQPQGVNDFDVAAYNVRAWDQEVKKGNQWTQPVSPQVVEAARRGQWSVVLTPLKAVPKAWFGALEGQRVLGLASAGGQQGPVLSAAGADVTIFDASPGQLSRDQEVAKRDGLGLKTVQGDMRDLSVFEDASFDLVFHPVSNCFCPEILPVWREIARVLRPGGALLAGFCNPTLHMMDTDELEKGRLVVRYALPYSDVHSLNEEQRRKYTDNEEPLIYGHTLEDQIGGQLAAGLMLTHMFEDKGCSGEEAAFNDYASAFIATRAIKPG